MIPVFKIFKKDKTDDWVTILMNPLNPFDVNAKKEFYKQLGYKIKEL